MAFRLTSTDSAVQQIRALPISATTGAAIKCDSTAATTDTSFCVWCYFESDPGADDSYSIFKTYTAANTNHLSLYLKRESSGSVWKIVPYFKSNALTTYTLPSSPIGKWYLLVFTHRARTATANDYWYLTVHDVAAGTTVIGASGITTAVGTVPDNACIGGFTTSEGSFSKGALGIFIPAILTGVFIVDGSTQDSVSTVSAATLVTGKGLEGPIAYNSFASCVWSANYSAGAWNSANEDARPGKALLAGGDGSGNMAVFDKNAGVNPNYHQQPRGSTITGTIYSVEPYAYGSMSYPTPTDTTVGSEALPATAVTLAATGRRGRNLTKLANWINDGTGSGRLRVGVHGNSRASIFSQYPLRLSDGTFPGRTVGNNFVDMGLVGQANLWNNGRIVGMFVPVPTCQWTGTNQLEGEYGCDCSAALLRCRDATDTLANPSAVLTSLVNSTLGSRMVPASRTATTVPSNGASADNYRGNGAAVRLSPGCKYRVMIRPEAGLPVTDPLTIRLHFLNYPNSSSIGAARKVVAAGQNDAEDSSSAIATIPGLGQDSSGGVYGTVAVTGVSAASLSSQIAHTSYGYVTIDDTAGNFSALRAGDLMQLHDSGGVANVYNEAWIVYAVTGQGTETCNVYYEWLPRNAPIVGDLVSFIKASDIMKTIEATFTAGEVAAGKWRGIEILDGNDGDGVVLWGLEFFNSARDGVIPVTLGRNGCGAMIQAARMPRVAEPDGSSLSKRQFELLDLDVAVMTTADQGNAGGNYVSAYNTLVDYYQVDTPSTELVLYSTGPEFESENVVSKVDYGNKYDYHAVMQYVADAQDIPHAGYMFSAYTSAFGRLMLGHLTEGGSHPDTVRDIAFLAAQLDGLTPEATSLGHGFGGRTRSGLRYRG